MNVAAALSFPFRGPHAWANIGCALVCFLIPFVGPMVLLGYIIGVERKLLETLDADAPRFDFGKFAFYLTRGVWPFLASLVLALFVLPVGFLFFGGLFGGIFLVERHPVAAVVVIAVATMIYIAALILFNLGAAPLVLKAGFEERFGAAFDFRFMVDYLKRVWLLALGMNLLLTLMLMPFMCFFFIPIVNIFVGYGVMAVFMFVQAHVRMQLYCKYLDRGGLAIILKPDLTVEPGFPVLPTKDTPGVG